MRFKKITTTSSAGSAERSCNANGWSFSWESMAMVERESLEIRCVEGLHSLYVSVHTIVVGWI